MTKRMILSAVMTVALALFVMCGVAKADTAADIAALKTQIADLQKKVDALEASTKAAPAGAPAQLPFDFHGWVRTRAYAGNDYSRSHLTAEEFNFSPHVTVSSDADADLHLYFYPATPNGGSQATPFTYVEAAYITLKNLPLNGKLEVGKDRNWAYGLTPTGGSRMMSNYSLYEDTFTRDRVVGLQYLAKVGSKKKVDLNMAVINGYIVGSRIVGAPGENSAGTWRDTAGAIPGGTTLNLANRDGNMNMDNNFSVSARIGGPLSRFVSAGLSGYVGKVGSTDLTTLSGLFANVNKSSRVKRQAGLDLRYKYKGFLLQGEGTLARVSNIGYYGYQILGGVTFSTKNSAYLRFGDLHFKDFPTSGRSQWALSLKRKLNPKLWLQAEYELNREKVTPKLDNNLMFLELFALY